MTSHSFPLNMKQIHAYIWAILLRSGRSEQLWKTGPSEKMLEGI